jgi:hypothetical protein
MGISSSLFDDFSILGLPKEREVAMQHCLNVVPVNIIEEQKHACDHGLSVDDLITTCMRCMMIKCLGLMVSHVIFTKPLTTFSHSMECRYN